MTLSFLSNRHKPQNISDLMSFIMRNIVSSPDEANIVVFIVARSLKINRKILIMMRKIILKYQYFSTFLK